MNDGICYQARDMEMERFRGDIMVRDCMLSSSSGRGPTAPRASQRQQLRRQRRVGTLGVNGHKGAMLIMESEKTIVGRPPAQPFSLYFIIIVCICRS